MENRNKIKGSLKVQLIEKAGLTNDHQKKPPKNRSTPDILGPKDFLVNLKNTGENHNMSSSLSNASFSLKQTPKMKKLELGSSGNLTTTNQKTKLPIIDNPYSRAFLDPNDTQKNSFMDLKRILYETNRKKKDRISPGKMTKKIIEDDYEEIDTSNYEEDLQNVKTLEKWNIELKKNKSSHLNKLDQGLAVAQKKELEVKDENELTPRVKTELINQIWTDFDGEKKTYATYANEMNNRDDAEENKISSKVQGSLEFSMQDSTANIMDDLIMKKIKKQYDAGEFDHMRDDQIYFTIQKAAEEVLGQFQSLKIASTNIGVQNHIMRIIKKIKTKKQEVDKTFDFSKEAYNEKKDGLDYKVTETILIKSYEKSTHEISIVKNRLDDVTRVLHEARFHVREELSQLEQIRKTIQDIDDKPDMLNKPENKQVSKRGNASLVEEYLRAQRMKAELRKQEQQVASAVTELEGLIRRSQAELELLEGDMRNAKNNKAYTKMRLKELYLKLLKDQDELMSNEYQTNMLWITRALQKIDQEVTPNIFPDYLDSQNIQYLLELAKLQEEFENHCRAYNLTGFNSAFEDFGSLKTLESHKDLERDDDSRKFDLHQTMATLARAKDRDQDTLMSEVHEKILELKRANLKAKRQVTFYQRGPKGKVVSKKFEDVNPYDTSIPLLDYNGQVYKTYEQTQESEYNKRSNSKDNSFKFEEGAIPLDKANAMHKKIESLKRNEALRIIKIYIAKENEAYAFERVKKIFRALFSKREAPEFLHLFMREKRLNDNKMTHTTSKFPSANLDRATPKERSNKFTMTGSLTLGNHTSPQNKFLKTLGSTSSPSLYQPKDTKYSHQMNLVS